MAAKKTTKGQRRTRSSTASQVAQEGSASVEEMPPAASPESAAEEPSVRKFGAWGVGAAVERSSVGSAAAYAAAETAVAEAESGLAAGQYAAGVAAGDAVAAAEAYGCEVNGRVAETIDSSIAAAAQAISETDLSPSASPASSDPEPEGPESYPD